jgi:hypothetical protein
MFYVAVETPNGGRMLLKPGDKIVFIGKESPKIEIVPSLNSERIIVRSPSGSLVTSCPSGGETTIYSLPMKTEAPATEAPLLFPLGNLDSLEEKFLSYKKSKKKRALANFEKWCGASGIKPTYPPQTVVRQGKTTKDNTSTQTEQKAPVPGVDFPMDWAGKVVATDFGHNNKPLSICHKP